MKDPIVTKSGSVSFKNIHPTRTAGGKVSGEEDNFIRCKQCGFILDRNLTSPGSGYGNETSSSITTIAGGTANAKDPTVGPGCPLCGSSVYE